MTLSALRREDLAVLGKLVVWRKLRLLERHTFVPDGELVPLRHRCTLVTIEICLCANLLEGVFDEARLPIAGKESIEGLDVGVDRELEGRVGCSVGGRVLEELLPACDIVAVIPRRICARRSHGYQVESRLRASDPGMGWRSSRTKFRRSIDLGAPFWTSG